MIFKINPDTNKTSFRVKLCCFLRVVFPPFFIAKNMERTGIEKKLFNACDQVISSEGYQFYDFEYFASQKIMRVFIMDPETNSADLDDCVKIDRALTPIFEDNEWIPEDIVLEVSSPGIYRKLKTKSHYEQSLGRRVRVKFRGKPFSFEGDKKFEKFLNGKVVIGTLESLSGDENFKINISCEFKDIVCPVTIEQEQVIRAQWEPHLHKLKN